MCGLRCNSSFFSTQRAGRGEGTLREESVCSYHDEAGGDRVVAAVAQLPKLDPVVLLAVQPSIFFIIPVGQRGAALATPEKRKHLPKLFNRNAQTRLLLANPDFRFCLRSDPRLIF